MTHDPIDPESEHGLTRRQALLAGATASAGLMIPAGLIAAASPAPALADAITLTPEQEEGPFYVALERVREDIVSGQVGVPLLLAITLLDASSGTALRCAAIDVWQCNPLGVTQTSPPRRPSAGPICVECRSPIAADSTKVYATEPYRKDKSARVPNTADRVYTQQGGSRSEVKVTRRGGSLAEHGFSATVTLAVDPSSTPAAAGAGTSGSGTGKPG